MLVLGSVLGFASMFLMRPYSEVIIRIRVLHATCIYHENGNSCAAYSVEGRVGEVLSFPNKQHQNVAISCSKVG